MPKTYYQDYQSATMHEFKTHLSHYVRMLEAGLIKGVEVKRGKKLVGFFMLHPNARAVSEQKEDNKNTIG